MCSSDLPPGSRPAEATALQKIREMAAALAPEATEQYKEQIRINACDYDPETNPALARQLADAEALASYPLGTKEDIDKAVERPTGFIQALETGMKSHPAFTSMYTGQFSMASEAIKRQVAGDHYVKMGLQPWDVIDESFTKNEAAAFYRGNCIKYLMRAGKKGEFKEDIQKAQHYLEKLLEILE